MAVSPAFELLKVAEADFPSRFGHFRIFGFEGRYPSGVEEAVVLRLGDMSGHPPLVRIHSECLTGDVFHSFDAIAALSSNWLCTGWARRAGA